MNGVAGFFCVGVSLYALSYLFMNHGFILSKGDLASNTIWQTAFYMHFIGGAIALGVGWTQFLKRFRNKKIHVHRTIGKIYIIVILMISAPGAFYMATLANGGFNNKMGFGLMAVCWFGFTLTAYLKVKQGNIISHEKWMIRSFAVTLAAVSLRLLMPIMIISGVDPAEAYQAVSWLCWVPNLFIAEYIIGQKFMV